LIVYKEKTDRHATEARDDGFNADRRAKVARDDGIVWQIAIPCCVNIFRRA